MFQILRNYNFNQLIHQLKARLITIVAFIAALVFFLFYPMTAPGQLNSEPQIKLSLAFSKPYYSANERLVTKIRIQNPGKETISRISVKLEVGPPQKLGEEKKNWPRTLSRLKYVGLIEPGEEEIEIDSDLSLLNLQEGVYPVTITAFRLGRVFTEIDVPLVIINQAKRRPLQMVIIWNYHERAFFTPDGMLEDDAVKKIQKSFQRFPQKPGYLSNFISALDKHPKIKASAHLSPLLLEQIIKITEEEQLEESEENEENKVGKGIAPQAGQIIEDFKKKISNKQIEILPSPFALASLTDLADHDWDSDGILQTEKGINSITTNLNLESPPEGFYCTDLLLTDHSIKYLTENDVQYTILSQEIFDNISVSSEDRFHPYIAQDINNNKLNIFFADNNLENLITSKNSYQQIEQEMLGYLAQIYLMEPKEDRVVAFSPTDRNWKPTFDLMDKLYQTVDEISWLQPVTLKEALENTPPPVKPLTLPDSLDSSSFTEDEYYSKINKIRNEVIAYKKMATPENPAFEEVEKNLLIAESSDWLNISNDPKIVNNGLDFMDAIKDTIKKEVENIKIPKKQTVTLISKRGKIPISITNNSKYEYTITINLKGPNVEFPEGKNKQVKLKPKENLITIPVIIKKAKNSTIDITLKNNKKILKESKVTVKTTYISRLIIISLTIGLILTIVLIIIFTSRRRTRKAK